MPKKRQSEVDRLQQWNVKEKDELLRKSENSKRAFETSDLQSGKDTREEEAEEEEAVLAQTTQSKDTNKNQTLDLQMENDTTLDEATEEEPVPAQIIQKKDNGPNKETKTNKRDNPSTPKEISSTQARKEKPASLKTPQPSGSRWFPGLFSGSTPTTTRPEKPEPEPRVSTSDSSSTVTLQPGPNSPSTRKEHTPSFNKQRSPLANRGQNKTTTARDDGEEEQDATSPSNQEQVPSFEKQTSYQRPIVDSIEHGSESPIVDQVVASDNTRKDAPSFNKQTSPQRPVENSIDHQSKSPIADQGGAHDNGEEDQGSTEKDFAIEAIRRIVEYWKANSLTLACTLKVGFEHQATTVTAQDIGSLTPGPNGEDGGWIGDTALYGALIVMALGEKQRRDVLLDGPLFVQNPQESEPLRDDEVKEIKKIVVPFLVRNNHWVSMVVDITGVTEEDGTVTDISADLSYISSLAGYDEEIQKKIKRYIGKKYANQRMKTTWHKVPTFQQTNGWDCGILTIMACINALEEEENNTTKEYSQSVLNNARMVAAYDLYKSAVSLENLRTDPKIDALEERLDCYPADREYFTHYVQARWALDLPKKKERPRNQRPDVAKLQLKICSYLPDYYQSRSEAKRHQITKYIESLNRDIKKANKNNGIAPAALFTFPIEWLRRLGPVFTFGTWYSSDDQQLIKVREDLSGFCEWYDFPIDLVQALGIGQAPSNLDKDNNDSDNHVVSSDSPDSSDSSDNSDKDIRRPKKEKDKRKEDDPKIKYMPHDVEIEISHPDRRTGENRDKFICDWVTEKSVILRNKRDYGTDPNLPIYETVGSSGIRSTALRWKRKNGEKLSERRDVKELDQAGWGSGIFLIGISSHPDPTNKDAMAMTEGGTRFTLERSKNVWTYLRLVELASQRATWYTVTDTRKYFGEDVVNSAMADLRLKNGQPESQKPKDWVTRQKGAALLSEEPPRRSARLGNQLPQGSFRLVRKRDPRSRGQDEYFRNSRHNPRSRIEPEYSEGFWLDTHQRHKKGSRGSVESVESEGTVEYQSGQRLTPRRHNQSGAPSTSRQPLHKKGNHRDSEESRYQSEQRPTSQQLFIKKGNRRDSEESEESVRPRYQSEQRLTPQHREKDNRREESEESVRPRYKFVAPITAEMDAMRKELAEKNAEIQRLRGKKSEGRYPTPESLRQGTPRVSKISRPKESIFITKDLNDLRKQMDNEDGVWETPRSGTIDGEFAYDE